MCVWVRETEMGERKRQRESEMRKRESDYLCESKSKQDREKNEVR